MLVDDRTTIESAVCLSIDAGVVAPSTGQQVAIATCKANIEAKINKHSEMYKDGFMLAIYGTSVGLQSVVSRCSPVFSWGCAWHGPPARWARATR